MFARIALIVALLFPVVAVAADGGFNVTDNAIIEHVPGSHMVTVTDANGDSYTVANAMRTEVDGKPVLLAQADTTAPALPIATPGPAADPTVLDELAALRKQYAAIKASSDSNARMLLWAGLIAGVLKLLLSVVNLAWKKPKKWLAWVAMATAVPIALLSHYAAGNGWIDSLIIAGGGPGAILFNELLKLLAKAPPATEPVKA